MLARRLAGSLAFVAGCLIAILVHPHVPDLAAQSARAAQVGRDGLTLGWTGWFAGVTPPAYSVLIPAVIAGFGLSVPSLVIFTISHVSGSRLVAGTRRPRWAVVLLDVGVLANLLSGRLPFGAGLATGLLALALLREAYGAPVSATRIAAAAVAGIAAALCSPLAGLFLGLVLLARVWTTDSARRRAALVAGVCLGAALVVLGGLFSDGGIEPVSTATFVRLLVGTLLIYLAADSAVVRGMALLSAGFAVVVVLVPNPVGDNAGRLMMLLGAAVFVATARWPRPLVIGGAAALLIWPTQLTAGDLHRSRDVATTAAYSAPLVAELARLAAAAGVPGRVEVIDTTAHWVDTYLVGGNLLARGWERQADVGRGRLFYDGALTAATYREWLAARAVRYIALPDAQLDRASAREATLVAGGLPFTTLVWRNAHWRLYAVASPTPLSTGVATVTAVDGTTLVLHADRAGEAVVAAWWSRWLSVDHGGCAGKTTGHATRVRLPAAGDYRLAARWSWSALIHPDGC